STSPGGRSTAAPTRRRAWRGRSPLSSRADEGRTIMDLGLKGRKGIVCASSRGLGRACALALAREGVGVVVNGRDPEQVEATAAAIRKETGAHVDAVAADLCTEDGRARIVAACP